MDIYTEVIMTRKWLLAAVWMMYTTNLSFPPHQQEFASHVHGKVPGCNTGPTKINRDKLYIELFHEKRPSVTQKKQGKLLWIRLTPLQWEPEVSIIQSLTTFQCLLNKAQGCTWQLGISFFLSQFSTLYFSSRTGTKGISTHTANFTLYIFCT